MLLRFAFTAALLGTLLTAQTKPDPDVLIFTDGEKLVGNLESSNGGSVTFKSDMVGQITVDWAKVQEIHSNVSFAVIPKNVTFRRHADLSSVPEGTISMSEQKLTVTTAGPRPKTVAVADAAQLVNDTEFRNALGRGESFFADWRGSLTGGASVVEATQQSRTFNGAVSLVRVEPAEAWLRRRNRTTFDFSGSYGTISQPKTPEVKTDIFHAGLERDEYLSKSYFGFGQALFDHNFSQNLSLAQTYGGGIGWSAIKRPNESFDLKAGFSYIHQKFSAAASDQSLIAATLEEDYKRGLSHGIQFTEQAVINPALNNSDAFSGTASALITMPVYKRMNSSFGIIDSYLHDPPPGFKKNSFQFTAGVTYLFR